MAYNRDILQVFEAIGLKLQGERLPDEGFPRSSLGPHTVWVKPKPSSVHEQRLYGSYRRAAKHRAMVCCGHCLREFSLGRLQQHLKRKDHQ